MSIQLCKTLYEMFKKFNSIKYQIYATLSANLLSIGYGIILGWPSPILPQLRSDESPLRFGKLNDNEITWISSCVCLGNLIGTLVIGLTVDRFGRKIGIYLTAIPLILSWILIISAHNVFHLYIARTLGGFVGGGTYIVIPLYITEISEDRIRGSLGSVVQVTCNFGILIGFLWGAYLNYYLVAYLSLLFPIIFLISFIIVPETPSYLISKNKIANAEQSLRFFRGLKNKNDVETVAYLKELEKIKDNTNNKKEDIQLKLDDFLCKSARKGILLSGVVMLGTQGCGMFFVVNYASMIFAEAGSALDPNLSSIIFVLVNFIGSYFSILLVDKLGRKLLLTYSALTSSISLFIVGLYLYMKHIGFDVSAFSWIPIVFLSATIFNTAWGILTLPYMVMTELLPTKIRGIVTTFWRTVLSIIAFLLLKYYYLLIERFHMYGCMWAFGLFCLAEMMIVILWLPETKGKSLSEIGNMLGGVK